MDLLDDIPTSSGEDEDDDIEKTLEEKDQTNWTWIGGKTMPQCLHSPSTSWTKVDGLHYRNFKMAAKETNRYASEKKHHVFETGNPAWRPVTKWKGFTFIAIQKAAGVMKVRSMQVL